MLTSCRRAAAAFSAFLQRVLVRVLGGQLAGLGRLGVLAAAAEELPDVADEAVVVLAVLLVDTLADGRLQRFVSVVGLHAGRRELNAQGVDQVALLAEVLAQLAQREVVAHALVGQVLQRRPEAVVEQVAVEDPVVGEDPRLGDLVRRGHLLRDQHRPAWRGRSCSERR